MIGETMGGYKQHPRLDDAVLLLSRLISVPSFSREEEGTARIWEEWMRERFGKRSQRLHNNLFVLPRCFDPCKPTLMLNSHHDTVRPVPSYTRDPFSPEIVDGRIYGLGSNDAGAAGVALAYSFLELDREEEKVPNLPFNVLLAITAAEEVMGEHGMRAFLPYLRERGLSPDMVIVGEPTGMQPAVAERGLVVLDGVAFGRSGHAARAEGINAIYRAIEDITTLREFEAPKVSPVLGPLKISVTMINAGTQHNVVPDRCSFVVDVRTTDAYTNEETVELLREAVKWTTLKPRSTRIQASVIPLDHPLTRAAVAQGLTPFVSPTTSDMALMHGIDSLKIGPGQSSRSHTADEYIELSELDEALWLYPRIIRSVSLSPTSKN